MAKLSPSGSALVYSTYLGGSGVDLGLSIAVDSGGNAYVTGLTQSTDFPTMSPLQPHLGGARGAFVTKIISAGSSLLSSTYLGGSGADDGSSIALDSGDNAYVTGVTQSTDFQFGGQVAGTVTFYDGTTALRTVSVSGGVAKFTTWTLTSGTHNITATYNGSTSFNSSSASLTQTLN